MKPVSQNPVVIIPGVLFWDSLYDIMKDALAVSIPEEKIAIAPVSLVDWIGFPPSPEKSTNRVMKAIDSTVRELERKFPGEPITLVAHSGGGILYLSTFRRIFLLDFVLFLLSVTSFKAMHREVSWKKCVISFIKVLRMTVMWAVME